MTTTEIFGLAILLQWGQVGRGSRAWKFWFISTFVSLADQILFWQSLIHWR